jgi:hypothetical protein
MIDRSLQTNREKGKRVFGGDEMKCFTDFGWLGRMELLSIGNSRTGMTMNQKEKKNPERSIHDGGIQGGLSLSLYIISIHLSDRRRYHTHIL